MSTNEIIATYSKIVESKYPGKGEAAAAVLAKYSAEIGATTRTRIMGDTDEVHAATIIQWVARKNANLVKELASLR